MGGSKVSDAAPMQYVFTTRVRCPSCRGLDLAVYATLPPDIEGNQLRYCRCRACDVKFKLLSEAENDGGYGPKEKD